MSLIVARKKGADIHLVSDTSLTYPEETFPDKALAAPGDGVIKVTILNPQLCIAFAGSDYEPAEEAIRVCRRYQSTPSKIKEHLLLVNLQTNGKVEFILCVGFPEYAIYEIKNLNLQQTEAAWIGSQSGFSIFQDSALEKKEVPKKIDTLLSEGMEHVIKSGRVPEVSGFRVSVSNEDNFFHYKNYMSTSIPPRTHTFKESSAQIIEIYGTPQEGGYSVSFCENGGRNDWVGIHVRQGEFGILYEIRNEGLLWPTVIPQVDEHEFNDLIFAKFGFRSGVMFSSLQKSYFNRGNKSFAKGDFMNAVKLYDLGLKENEEALRIALLFNSGLALQRMDRINEACERFDKAVKIDSKLEPLIQKAIYSH